jgi:2-iminobutanoate/2-iminopropanoate deaminase
MTERSELQIAGLAPPISHYTDAVLYGDLHFMSGCSAVDAERNLIGGDDSALQMRQVLENLGRVLNAAGVGFDSVFKVTFYLTDINDRPLINPVREEFFGQSRPASTLVEVSSLAFPGVRVEMDAIAGVSRAAPTLAK